MPDRARHPSIFKVGYVRESGDEVRIGGWGLGLCVPACPCHRHPVAGQLVIVEDQVNGTIGLKSFRLQDCGCCAPWHAEDLADILRDLHDFADLEPA